MKIFSLVLTISVCLLISFLVVKKPSFALPFVRKKGKKIYVESFWAAALIIPTVLLSVGAITPSEVVGGILSNKSMNPIKILVLFMSMCFISVMLDKAGFFEYCAQKVMSNPEKGQLRLFCLFYAVVSLLTVFTSNDIIILTFTPFIYYFSKNSGINPVPYIIAEFVAANTWSLMLIIGNPTNIYIASSMGVNFIDYLKVMALPAATAGLSSFFMLLLIFKKDLSVPFKQQNFSKASLKDKTMAIISLIDLALCVAVLTIGSYINVEMWFVSLVFALVLLFVAILVRLYRLGKKENGQSENYVKIKDVFAGLPYAVVPFLLSMFIAILTLEKQGVTEIFSRVLFSLADGKTSSGLIFGFTSALSSNVINNIPMSILFTSVLGAGEGAVNLPVALYSSVIGSNIGAFFSPIGALAGVMFMKILKDKGEGLSALSFIKYCAPVAVISLAASVLVLTLVI